MRSAPLALALTLSALAIFPAPCARAQAATGESARTAENAGTNEAERLRTVIDLEDARVPGGGALVAFSRAPEPPAVRVRALRALARQQDPAVAPALWAALEADPVPAAQAEAAFGLGLLAGVDTARLRKAYEAGRAPVAVLAALGRQGGPDDVPLLVSALGGPHARTAFISLGLIARRSSGRLEGVPDAALVTASAAGDRFGPAYLLMRATGWEEGRVWPLAQALLADPNPEIRAMACRALAGRPAATRLMAAAADTDPDERVRVEAVRALAKMRAPAATQALAEKVRGIAAGLRTPDALAGPALHRQIEILEAVLGLPDEPAAVAAAGEVLAAAGEVLAAAERAPKPANPGVSLGLSHVRCRAAALVDRAEHALRHLPTCAATELPPFVRETLTAPVLAALPESAREAAVDDFLSTASPAGRAAFFASVGPDAPPAWRARVLAGLAATDPAELAEAAGAAARLNEPAAGVPLVAALQRLVAAGDVETTLSLLDAVTSVKPVAAAAGPAVLAAARSPQPALRRAARDAAAALGLKPDDTPPAALEPTPLDAGPGPSRAHVLTTKGALVIELLGVEAPRTVANFARLARRGFYDGLLFHRVVPDFVAQAGDPRGDGWGGPGYMVRCESNPEPYLRGTVGMALAGQDTGGSQFFITHTGHPHLDAGYTVFGRLQSGFEALDALTVGDRIVKISIDSTIP